MEDSGPSKLSRYEPGVERQTYRGRCTSWSADKPPGAALTPPQVLNVGVTGMPEEAGRWDERSPGKAALHR